jgi:uncharacterized phiE125 gp8 family phage protein
MERMIVSLVTPADGQVMTLESLKTFLRVDHTDEDTVIQSLLSAATGQVEAFLKRQLLTATYDGFLDKFPPGGVIECSLPPLQSVSSVKYVDSAGVEQTWDPGNYTVDTVAERGRIYPNYQITWPTTRGQRKAVTVRFIAGYGAQEDIPADIIAAIKILVATLFENREDYITGTVVHKLPFASKQLLLPHVAWSE